MATTFETIYNTALRKLEDFDLANMPEQDLEDTLHGYLISAIAQFRKCKNDLKDRDEEAKQFNVDLEDEEIEILGIMVARQSLQPYVNSSLLAKQIVGGKEENWYSQASHLSQLQARDASLKIEAQKLSRDYTYANNNYFDS